MSIILYYTPVHTYNIIHSQAVYLPELQQWSPPSAAGFQPVTRPAASVTLWDDGYNSLLPANLFLHLYTQLPPEIKTEWGEKSSRGRVNTRNLPEITVPAAHITRQVTTSPAQCDKGDTLCTIITYKVSMCCCNNVSLCSNGRGNLILRSSVVKSTSCITISRSPRPIIWPCVSHCVFLCPKFQN